MTKQTQPSGFALPVAIFAIVVVGVLVTGGFFVARQESRIGVANQNAQLAMYMAERGIADIVDSVSAQTLTGMVVWDTMTVADTLPDGIVDVLITRTGTRTYFLDGTSRITGRGHLGGGTRRLGLISKLFSAVIDPPAALATTNELKIGGSSIINGNDSIPNGWDSYCDPNDTTTKPGIIIDDTSNVTYTGNNYEVHGEPKAVEDTTLTADELLMFGDLTWDDLVAMANIVGPNSAWSPKPGADSVASGGSWDCNITNIENWGHPKNPVGTCGNYFPIIYAPKDLKLTASTYNAGQGILLVEEDLDMAGGFTFFGPVIVKGTFTTSGTGGHVQGGVIAANANFEQTEVIGNAVVQYSTCGVERAILGNSNLTRLVPVAERSWVDLSNIGN